MKVMVIGPGQCGNNIADEFCKMDKIVRHNRKISVVVDAFAVNTDEGDLSGMKHLPRDYQHRILIGGRETSGHGVGKLNERAAKYAKDESQKIIDAIGANPNLFEVDAFLIAGSGGGGTGSGSIPFIVERIKKEYPQKYVYALVVLPYEYEENNEERTRLNTASCLKATYDRADAVILVDNERYASLFGRISANYFLVNQQIVNSFRDLLCAGEERKPERVGSRVVDAGDITATIEGWTIIGWGGYDVSLFKALAKDKKDFLKKSAETRKGIGALDKALKLISIKSGQKEYAEAQNVLYLFSAPEKEMNLDTIKDSERYLKELMPEALIRGGTYPYERRAIEATVILSKMGELERIKNIYRAGEEFTKVMENRQKDYEGKLDKIKRLGEGVPDL